MVLFLTYQRPEYTKQAFNALLDSDCGNIIVIDNGSNYGLPLWLSQQASDRVTILLNGKNLGISGAMNQFLSLSNGCEFVGKIDSDTIVKNDWWNILKNDLIENNLDAIQCKHHIIKETNPNGWDGFTSKMKNPKLGIFLNHFIGGSGIIFRREKVNNIPNTNSAIMGWREFQKQNPNFKVGFSENTEIKLLDEGGYYDYPEYYKETGRIK